MEVPVVPGAIIVPKPCITAVLHPYPESGSLYLIDHNTGRKLVVTTYYVYLRKLRKLVWKLYHSTLILLARTIDGSKPGTYLNTELPGHAAKYIDTSAKAVYPHTPTRIIRVATCSNTLNVLAQDLVA
jgi:hypothetical protein